MNNKHIIDDVLKFASKLKKAPRGKDWKSYKCATNTPPPFGQVMNHYHLYLF